MELVTPKPNILIASCDTPQSLQNGSISWKCVFGIHNCDIDGYLIQEVLITTKNFIKANGTFVAQNALPEIKTYWESWKIIKGVKQVVSVTATDSLLIRDFSDVYQITPPPSDIRKIEYAIGTFAVYKGPLTKDFISNNRATYAGDIPSTTTKPSTWPGPSHPRHSMYVCHKEDGSKLVSTLTPVGLKLYSFDQQNALTEITGKSEIDIINYFRKTNGDGNP